MAPPPAADTERALDVLQAQEDKRAPTAAPVPGRTADSLRLRSATGLIAEPWPVAIEPADREQYAHFEDRPVKRVAERRRLACPSERYDPSWQWN